MGLRSQEESQLTAEHSDAMLNAMKTLTFRIIIEPDERGAFHGYVPALPGCHTWGKTIPETRKHLRDAMRAYLRSLKADGLPIPHDGGFELIETLSAKDILSRRRSPTYA